VDYRGVRALQGAYWRGLVLVVVVTVSGVAVTVVDVVNVVAVRDSNVAATLAVGVVAVRFGLNVLVGLALVPVAFVLAVDVAIVYEVGVILVRESDVAAAFAVGVLVFSVGSVSHNHESFLCLRPRSDLLVFTLFSLNHVFSSVSIARRKFSIFFNRP